MNWLHRSCAHAHFTRSNVASDLFHFMPKQMGHVKGIAPCKMGTSTRSVHPIQTLQVKILFTNKRYTDKLVQLGYLPLKWPICSGIKWHILWNNDFKYLSYASSVAKPDMIFGLTLSDVLDKPDLNTNYKIMTMK